ncbi:4-(cytidine 5'-diphospho)-2-C-methyl-D-erythritol kinase [Sulfitobacter alexandrii]|uniref:4-diphosphocytidyl-2-C-methyl-D-erythritol kinase n=1 Tax=Sulfitobacter alexandrii TaxID=1917485 RepID=A0A1J0WEN1_9RHOB|nr:4-(cytidine 5'-diphospho)-2-C-methyl-D-erythritol kinase [Sulfitobacter alexandrii]
MRAPAKINLTLHITGKRDDGYHLLDSLVVFADVGDRLEYTVGGPLSLSITGPEAGGLEAGPSNLVLRAASLAEADGGRFKLEKNLPVSSGIGGGSADAAAAVRVLLAMGASGGAQAAAVDPAARFLPLGADVPVCLDCRPVRMQGIGEILTPMPDLPGLHAVLINPRVALATPVVFRELQRAENAPMPATLPDFEGRRHLVSWLRDQRNDLQEAALSLVPAIGDVLAALEGAQGCLLARMSGSGATCFGLFDHAASAKTAAARISDRHPHWWVTPTQLGDMQALSQPRISRSG